jgi:uncharacterized protein YigE (DUF2233 family)
MCLSFEWHEVPVKRVIAVMLCVLFSLAVKAENSAFTVIKVDLSSEDLRIFWKDQSGSPLRTFERLSGWLVTQNKKLVFGMNAGMYHADASPVGLLVLAGKQITPLNISSGAGNFFLKPNGVFLISSNAARVVDTVDYQKFSDGVRYATQSGPLLLKNGQINSAFNPASTSRLIRNGVCAAGTTALFVISEKPVNFHEFAVFLREELRCTDALYLDGTVSSLYSPEHGRSDFRAELGPLFGVVQ